MKHGKKTHYFYRCFVSCSNCSVGGRQLHTLDHTSSELLGASPLLLTASQGLAAPGEEAQHSKAWNGCLNLHLESSSHPLRGKKLLLFPGFVFPVFYQRCQSVGRALQGSCLGYNTAAAWARSSLRKLRPEPHINLWVNYSHWVSQKLILLAEI